MRIVLLFSFLVRRHSLFSARTNSLCVDKKYPFVNGGMHKQRRSAPNFVIIKLKHRLFRFSLKIFPSFTGRWTLSHWAVNDRSLGVEWSVTGRWTTERCPSVNGKMYIWKRNDVHLETEWRTYRNGKYEVPKTSLRKGLNNVAFHRADKLVRILYLLYRNSNAKIFH